MDEIRKAGRDHGAMAEVYSANITSRYGVREVEESREDTARQPDMKLQRTSDSIMGVFSYSQTAIKDSCSRRSYYIRDIDRQTDRD